MTTGFPLFRRPNYFDSLDLELRADNSFKKFYLNDLWVTNAKTFELHDVTIKLKDLNRFFKLWMKRMCNPRLEHFQVRIPDKASKDIILEGLNAVQVSLETKRAFPVLRKVEQLTEERITAEFDITRADGRTATIRFGKGYRSDYISFYIWPGSTYDTSFLESLVMFMVPYFPDFYDIEDFNSLNVFFFFNFCLYGFPCFYYCLCFILLLLGFLLSCYSRFRLLFG